LKYLSWRGVTLKESRKKSPPLFLGEGWVGLLQITEIVAGFELNYELVHEFDHVFYVVFVHGFYGGVHVLQW
jgi:hypothetical protein